MKWKDSDEGMDSGDDSGSAYEEDYSPLRSKNFAFGSKLASVIVQPGVWVFVVVVVLALITFFMFLPKGETTVPQAKLNQSLHELERKITSLEEQNKKMNDLIKANQESTDPLLVRLDRLESKFGQQLSDLHKQIKQLKRFQSQKAQTTGPKKVSTKKTTQKSAETYTVQKGDTLYSISKQFSVSISQLRKRNKLSSNAAIFPGQKLIIKP